jgi:hypothetical protein
VLRVYSEPAAVRMLFLGFAAQCSGARRSPRASAPAGSEDIEEHRTIHAADGASGV